MPRWVVNEREEDEASSSEESEEELEYENDEEETTEQLPEAAKVNNQRRGQKITISLRNEQVCHVCGKKGHQAGFVGPKYIDCPNKPCYLCKQPGHTTATCPYRIAPEHGCTAAANTTTNHVLFALRKREGDARPCHLWRSSTDYSVEAAVLKLHSQRCTCLEFHPTKDNLVLSGDKKGGIAVWDFERVYERAVFKTVHSCLTNALRFLPRGDGMSCVTTSSDGTCKVVDIETGCADSLINLNPDGWIEGVSSEKNWGMLYGMDVLQDINLVVAGDSAGSVHFVDTRCKKVLRKQMVHKKGSKVTSLHAHPASPHLLLSGGADHNVQLLDIRAMGQQQQTGVKGEVLGQLCVLEHPRVVNSAYFSPMSGNKIMTTCQDNRLRVWDNVLTLDGEPDREIVHSHDFNRYLTPFKAEWDPKDPLERTVVLGRYISEDFDGVALHPVDIMDAATGKLLAELVDPNLTTICPVNKPHPRLDVIITGSSRSLYAWRLKEKDEHEDLPYRDGSKYNAAGMGSSSLLQRSGDFVFFDADDDVKRAKKASLHHMKPPGPGCELEEEEEEASKDTRKRKNMPKKPAKVVKETSTRKKRK